MVLLLVARARLSWWTRRQRLPRVCVRGTRAYFSILFLFLFLILCDSGCESRGAFETIGDYVELCICARATGLLASGWASECHAIVRNWWGGSWIN